MCKDAGLVEHFVRTALDHFGGKILEWQMSFTLIYVEITSHFCPITLLPYMQTEGRGYTLIYYTGERPIVLEKELPANVFIFLGRPDLAKSKLWYSSL